MAIVNMQKLSICASKKHRKEILEAIQSMGNMEITFRDFDGENALQTMDTQAARQKYERRAVSFDDALKLIGEYSGEKVAGGGLFSEKAFVDASRYEKAIENRHEYNVEVAEILRASKDISECDGQIQKAENLKESLVPWMGLDIPMSSVGTRMTAVLIGTIPGLMKDEALGELASKDISHPGAVSARVISAANDVSCVSVICMKDDENKVTENLRSAGFSRPAQMIAGIPSEEAAKCDRIIADMEAKKEEDKKTIASYIKSVKYYRIMADYYRSRAEKYRILGDVPQSGNVFFLQGWVPAEQADRVGSLLSEKFGAYVEKENSDSGEMEPTLLKNNKFSQNAEGVLASYGLPKKGRVDPTFIMSIFYVIFFGMMLSDAAYGIIMFIGCAVILAKKKNLDEGLAKMLKLFFWCGISTAFWGFMYGGFFGDAIDVAATTFFGYSGDKIVKALWFEPINDPMRLLMFCMLFGVIHLFVGLGIKGFELLKGRDIVGFVCDVLSWYLFLCGLLLLLLPSDIFASISGTVYVFPDWVGPFAIAITVIGAVIILIMSGRGRKNWFLRIALGAYDLYGVTGWLSDVLSYSRLLALGLATGVIASVINMIATMFGGGVLGVIIFIVVFVLGHTLNIAINALGAYVHTNRLQYVEFFGKFYDAGGKPFRPFKNETKYITVKGGNGK
ncbi:MAG: V-type ATP synthase subunit I [Eubacterium sp.]|nr:V-type ATP synthase subunit I [Eubacterium sp.]